MIFILSCLRGQASSIFKKLASRLRRNDSYVVLKLLNHSLSSSRGGLGHRGDPAKNNQRSGLLRVARNDGGAHQNTFQGLYGGRISFSFLSFIMVLCCSVFLAVPASAQIYSTRDNLPKNSPFGRASPEALVPEPPPGPRSSTSAPVEAVDSGEAPEVQAVEAQDLAPPTADAQAPQPLTATVYTQEKEGAPRVAVLRCLNKVTAKFQELSVKVGEAVQFGQLSIMPLACRSATPESQPEYAALLQILEAKVASGKAPSVPVPTAIFSGWVLASSPSLNGLEHPVYDISIVRCKAPKKNKS